MILAYPVITMGKHAHKGSRLRILGKGNVADQQLRDLYSIEKQVTEHYPPAYIWQCEADNTVPIQNSAMMAEEAGNSLPVPCLSGKCSRLGTGYRKGRRGMAG